MSAFAWTEAPDTPDILVARLKFTTVLCKSTGEPVDLLDKLISRQLVQQLNLPASYAITMNMDDANYPYAVYEQFPRAKVYRAATSTELAIDPTTQNVLCFYGSLPSDAIDEDSETGQAKLTFQEPSWVFNDRYLPANVTFSQVDQGTILWDVIATENAKTNGDTWIRQGSVATGTLRDRTYSAGKNVSGLIQDMTTVDGGCDVGLTPVDYWSIDGSRGMATFNAYSQRGSDMPSVLFIHGDTLTDGTSGGLPSNCSGFRRTRAKTITSATSVGSADTQTYANTTSPAGLLETYDTYSDVSISQTLLDKSVGTVANAQNAPMVLEIKNPFDAGPNAAPQPLIDYGLGDTVYATERRGGMVFIGLPVRVHGIDVTISQEGALTTKPTVATLPQTIVSPVLPGGGTGGALGSERVTLPASGHGAANFIYPSSAVPSPDGSTVVAVTTTGGNVEGTIAGGINGLVVGQKYAFTMQVRGSDIAPSGGGTIFAAWVDSVVSVPSIGSGSSTFSSNDAANVWSATLATRQAWNLLTVTFTATRTSYYCGVEINESDANPVYTASWAVNPA